MLQTHRVSQYARSHDVRSVCYNPIASVSTLGHIKCNSMLHGHITSDSNRCGAQSCKDLGTKDSAQQVTITNSPVMMLCGAADPTPRSEASRPDGRLSKGQECLEHAPASSYIWAAEHNSNICNSFGEVYNYKLHSTTVRATIGNVRIARDNFSIENKPSKPIAEQIVLK